VDEGIRRTDAGTSAICLTLNDVASTPHRGASPAQVVIERFCLDEKDFQATIASARAFL